MYYIVIFLRTLLVCFLFDVNCKAGFLNNFNFGFESYLFTLSLQFVKNISSDSYKVRPN